MTWFRSFVACPSFVLLSVSLAATPKAAPRPTRRPVAKPAAAPSPVNRVVIKLRDGSAVGGEFVEATPAGVPIKCATCNGTGLKSVATQPAKESA